MPLTCFKCGRSMPSMPALKQHLDDEFRDERKSKLGTRLKP